MKLFHLSDLHLGKRVYAFSMLRDQRYVLEQVCALAEKHQPDGILLLDMEHHTLQEIRFSYPDKKRYRLVYYSLFFLLLGLGIYSILPVF